ncbi:hypothetical protein SAMN04487912_102550 [Arthrobacter sp. cf158]|uniref:sunset domain-containing protein n=1 Tax=Arthrobacter sp. cf158 TaxID=1761744 RepID=UPI00089A8D80|nr:hypothetical protein [Arthrobacter sp. cf158]SDW37765.1 hypothetical protein SAMN04487912_102550 [Arthrobacter sp. cf158]
MDTWFIWVIVIVLVIAIVWWLMNRNKTRNSTSPQAPAAMEPSNTGSIPDTAAAAAGVAGLAGVTNLGKAAAEGSGPTHDEPGIVDEPGDAEPDTEGHSNSVEDRTPDASHATGSGQDMETEPRSVIEDSPGTVPAETQPVPAESQPAATPGLMVPEPAIAAPAVDEPAVEEPVVDEPLVDRDGKVHAADAGDVDDWDAGAPPTTAEEAQATAGGSPAPQVTADDVTRADEAADKAEWESSWTDAGGTPVHHHEYTDAHSPTLPGAESAAAEDPAASGHLAAEHPYGTGSSSTPGEAYPVKASATDMTYHDEDAAGYGDVAADVWFESAAHAEAAGFRPPRRNRH